MYVNVWYIATKSVKVYKSIEATDMEYFFLATVPTWSICGKATDMEYKSSEPTHVEHFKKYYV
jgi:hypothetical protein